MLASVMPVIVTVLRHPSVWTTALRQLFRLAPRRWWRVAPFLPIPAPAYTEFRLITQYGDPAHRPEPDDVVNYLRWCKAWGS